jgi:hypothetical protein
MIPLREVVQSSWVRSAEPRSSGLDYGPADWTTVQRTGLRSSGLDYGPADWTTVQRTGPQSSGLDHSPADWTTVHKEGQGIHVEFVAETAAAGCPEGVRLLSCLATCAHSFLVFSQECFCGLDKCLVAIMVDHVLCTFDLHHITVAPQADHLL